MNRYEDVIWVVGDGRSGTTWLGDLINFDRRRRQLFEPFHPMLVEPMKEFNPFQYIRPEDRPENLYRLTKRVFNGAFQHPRVDRFSDGFLYDGLIIKDIFANLFVKWAHVHFPMVKKILILRHPFAVALSKQKLQRWSWLNDPLEFLNQKQLFQDHLLPFEDTIKRANSYFERQVTIWAIVHYVPFRQLTQNELCIVFYEDLCNNPETELKRLFEYLSPDTSNESLAGALSILDVPTVVTRSRTGATVGKKALDGWRKELTPDQIESGLAILRAFHLDGVYSDQLYPNRTAVEDLLALNTKKTANEREHFPR